MESNTDGFFQDCKPWESECLNDNINLLNNLNHNLADYEAVYKKHVGKSKCTLPKINHHKTTQKSSQQTKRSNNLNPFCQKQYLLRIQKSLNLKHSLSSDNHFRKVACIRFETGLEKQNNANPITDRKYTNSTNRVNQYLLNFDELNKYRRMQKRQLHQMVFGNKTKLNKYQQDPIYHCLH